jgi:hypothetical protein
MIDIIVKQINDEEGHKVKITISNEAAPTIFLFCNPYYAEQFVHGMEAVCLVAGIGYQHRHTLPA